MGDTVEKVSSCSLPALSAVFFDLCAVFAFSQAHAQSRSELIQSARMEKGTNLTPEPPPKSERVIVKAQNSLPYRLLTGHAHGFGVSFGNMAPGLGFAMGPTCTKPTGESNIVLRIDARCHSPAISPMRAHVHSSELHSHTRIHPRLLTRSAMRKGVMTRHSLFQESPKKNNARSPIAKHEDDIDSAYRPMP
jgi:hypothetical protein